MKYFVKTTAFLLAVLFAFSPLVGGALNLLSFAEEDDFVESPIIPMEPSSGDGGQTGFSYSFDEEKHTASVTDYVGEETAIAIPAAVLDGEEEYTVISVATGAFSGTVSLKSVAIPATVKTVEAYAFDACLALTDVWYEGDKASFVQISIADGNEAIIYADIHFGACMGSAGPDFVHSYDNSDDAECNGCGKARETEYIPGDVDGSNEIDLDDAIYLLFSFYYPERYPVYQEVDYDGSGAFDFDDIFYLLYHINFPDRYPIA